jgi:uncharacterized protein YdaU (DUF1376 family)
MKEPRNGLFVEYCAKDFLDGTQNLDVWEELVYRRLVDLIYAHNDKLIDDGKKLAWMTKAGSRWPKIKAVLIEAGKIEVVEGRITNARCQKELEKSARKIEQKRMAGKASADARSETRKCPENNETTPTAVGTAVPTDVPTADPTAGQLTNNPLNQEESKKPIASAIGPQAVDEPQDLGQIVWGPMLKWLIGRTGHTEPRARALIGKWLGKAKGEAELLELMRNAAKFSPVDPVSWIEGEFKRNGKAKQNVHQLNLTRTYQPEPDLIFRALSKGITGFDDAIAELDNIGARAG